MQIHIHAQISQINANQWNRLVTDNNPFMRHEFLAALETHECASPEFGWHPSHIAIYEDGDDEKQQTKLIAAMPLYAKTNS